MGELIWANLCARPTRTVLSVFAVALQVFLLLFLMGLTDGIAREWSERVAGIGADLLVQPPNASIFLAFSRAVLPEELGEQIGQVDGVETVSPTIAVVNNRGLTMIYGIDYDSFNRLGKGFLFHSGGPFESEFDVIIDDIKAKGDNLQVGDAVLLLDRQWRVSGIVEHGRGARFFILLRTAQQIFDLDTVSMFWVQTAPTAQTDQVQKRIREILPRHQVRDMDEFRSLMVSGNIPMIHVFTNAIILIGLLDSLLVVLLSMYTVVLERTREIGILKSLGATRWDIAGLMVREAWIIGLLGVVVGVGASYGVREVVVSMRPTMNIDITQYWLLRGTLLALLGCTLGAFYPALKASAMDTVEALGYN